MMMQFLSHLTVIVPKEVITIKGAEVTAFEVKPMLSRIKIRRKEESRASQTFDYMMIHVNKV